MDWWTIRDLWFIDIDNFLFYTVGGGGKDGANKSTEMETASLTTVVTSLPETENVHSIASDSLLKTKTVGNGASSSLPETESM